MKISKLDIESVDYLVTTIPMIMRNGSSGHKRLQQVITLLVNYQLVKQEEKDYSEFAF